MATIRGGAKLEARLARMTASLASAGTLEVGFLANATYPDGTSVALVAALQNFGTRAIPARPFFSNMVRDKSPGWPDDLGKVLKATNYDASRSLRLMGELIKGQLQQSIKDTNSPPLKRATIIAKGGTAGMKYDPKNPSTFAAKPLVRSGHMLRSVDYEVVK